MQKSAALDSCQICGGRRFVVVGKKRRRRVCLDCRARRARDMRARHPKARPGETIEDLWRRRRAHLDKQAARARRWYAANPEKARAASRAWKQKHLQWVREYSALYHEEHRDRILRAKRAQRHRAGMKLRRFRGL